MDIGSQGFSERKRESERDIYIRGKGFKERERERDWNLVIQIDIETLADRGLEKERERLGIGGLGRQSEKARYLVLGV